MTFPSDTATSHRAIASSWGCAPGAKRPRGLSRRPSVAAAAGAYAAAAGCSASTRRAASCLPPPHASAGFHSLRHPHPHQAALAGLLRRCPPTRSTIGQATTTHRLPRDPALILLPPGEDDVRAMPHDRSSSSSLFRHTCNANSETRHAIARSAIFVLVPVHTFLLNAAARSGPPN